ncbi:MAG: hypothetical protein JHC32_07685 [Candidatus Aminicenantes bacterium]|jgi:hypothetical protein|nr:hypothetical protein [Candidatus Aminicenantes bacterium]
MAEKKKKVSVQKSAAKKAVGRKAPGKKLLSGFECEICGYRLLVDRECGCGEEHVILCCNQPMKKINIEA